jgi:cell division protein FtsI (penicillin-binding protein 3)
MRSYFKRRNRKVAAYILSGADGKLPAEPAARSAPIAGRSTRTSRRIALCGLAFGGAFAALAIRLSIVSLGGGESGDASGHIADASAARPEILDRNGTLLAANLPVIALQVSGKEVWSPEETATTLARNFPAIDAAALQDKLERGLFAEPLSDLTPADQARAFALGLPGVHFLTRSKRFYPQERLASHIVGHIEEGRGGVMGLERALDTRGANGPIVASLDLRVQQVLEEELAAGVTEYRAVAAWGVVLDAETAEVVAIASLPDFDPNQPGAAPADARRNRAVYDRYELGSALKAMTAAAAVEAGVAGVGSTYDAPAFVKVADRIIRDFHPENRVLTFFEVIEKSSNVGMVKMAQDLGVTRQKASLKALGLLDPLPIELAENRAPQTPAKWGPVESATVSFGHGLSITPLHLAAAYAAVVNGGEYRAPTFLKSTIARPGARVFSEATSETMRNALRHVVTSGTGRSAEVAGYFPIGKTATAEKVAVGGYDKDNRISSFVGAFPGDAPRYIVLVSYDEPKPTAKSWGYATAGWNAAPTFSRIVARIAPRLGVMPIKDPWAVASVDGARSVGGAM